MFSLNRLSVIGLGAGLVLVGCASPTDETADTTDETGAAITTESAEAQPVNEEVTQATETQGSEIATAMAEDATDDGPTETKSDKIIIGGGWGMPGWGGGLGWGGLGWGGLGWGGVGFNRSVGWGGSWGMPGFGWGGAWGVPVGVGWGGAWGVPVGVGWGGAGWGGVPFGWGVPGVGWGGRFF